MLPSRCVRCGAASRDFVCASCADYLIADRPLWLDPALLPGPSLLELAVPQEVAFVSADLTQIEWGEARSDPISDAVRLVQLLGLRKGPRPALSVGDAEILHAFLREARRSPPTNAEEREALASVYRYLSSSASMPPHLASEYALRSNVLAPPPLPPAAEAEEEFAPLVEEGPAPIDAATTPSLPETEPPESVGEEPLPDLPEMDLGPAEDEVSLPAPEPFPPEPIPAPEPPLPLPEPIPSPEPEPEPEPIPEESPLDESQREEFEELRQALAKERADAEAWARSRTEEFAAKEATFVERERDLAAKAQDIEAEARAATERLAALELDEARRDVIRFLSSIPGMSASEADVIASAFPDMESLQAADANALQQCKGVTQTLARAIRHELVPGEVDEEERATLLREEAHAFLEEGNYTAALDCFDRLLRDRPQDLGLWFDRAQLLVLLQRPEEALQCYRRVLDVDRRNRQAWFERANLLFGLGRLADAIDSLREVLRIDPSKGADIVLKAEQLRRDGHSNEAAILFQAVLEVTPGEARAILGLGDTLLGLGDVDAAEALFTQALGKNPQNAPILFRKGELLERKGRWGAAIQYYNRAIAMRWDFEAPWLAKGLILVDHGRAPESIECLDKAAALAPDDIRAWVGKARAHTAVGDHEAAVAALSRARAINPDDPTLRAAQDAIGVRAPAPEVAAAPAEAPTDLRSLAKAFEEIEEEPEQGPQAPAPSPDFQTFVESIEPDQEEIHVLLQFAELALEGGDPQMALLRYEQIIERDERNADAWAGKGVALQQVELHKEALEAYDRALALKPDHELATKWRATCLRRLRREAPE